MKPAYARFRWETFQAKAHLPEVQAIVRWGLSRRTIRVVPARGGGIRSMPTMDDRPLQAFEPSAPTCLGSIAPSAVRVRSLERRAP